MKCSRCGHEGHDFFPIYDDIINSDDSNKPIKKIREMMYWCPVCTRYIDREEYSNGDLVEAKYGKRGKEYVPIFNKSTGVGEVLQPSIA